jgi:hypothetical protein
MNCIPAAEPLEPATTARTPGSRRLIRFGPSGSIALDWTCSRHTSTGRSGCAGAELTAAPGGGERSAAVATVDPKLITHRRNGSTRPLSTSSCCTT